MKKKIIILAISLIAFGISFFIYAAANLTRLLDSDILDIPFDEEDF